MSTLAIGDLASVVLPPNAQDGVLGMLTAYFDDSGTHSGSDIVLLAGIFGNQWQWNLFNRLWIEKLANPLPGRPALERFHMTDCFNSLNEFEGWRREETDYFAHEMIGIILRASLWGGATSVSAKAWNHHVTGDLRRASGDPEGGAIRNSFYMAIDWARTHASYDSQIAFVFEDRPDRKAEYQAVYNVFSDHNNATGMRPEIASLTFVQARKFLPLQAADLLAWEIYRDELYFFGKHRKPNQFHRKPLIRLLESGQFRIAAATPETIEKMIEAERRYFAENPHIMADVHKYFGPLVSSL